MGGWGRGRRLYKEFEIFPRGAKSTALSRRKFVKGPSSLGNQWRSYHID